MEPEIKYRNSIYTLFQDENRVTLYTSMKAQHETIFSDKFKLEIIELIQITTGEFVEFDCMYFAPNIENGVSVKDLKKGIVYNFNKL